MQLLLDEVILRAAIPRDASERDDYSQAMIAVIEGSEAPYRLKEVLRTVAYVFGKQHYGSSQGVH